MRYCRIACHTHLAPTKCSLACAVLEWPLSEVSRPVPPSRDRDHRKGWVSPPRKGRDTGILPGTLSWFVCVPEYPGYRLLSFTHEYVYQMECNYGVLTETFSNHCFQLLVRPYIVPALTHQDVPTLSHTCEG